MVYQIFKKNVKVKIYERCAYKMCAHTKNAQDKRLKKYKTCPISFYKELNNVIIDEKTFLFMNKFFLLI